MDYEIRSVDTQSALPSLHERKFQTLSQLYEPLATSRDVDNNSQLFSYEAINNDMWKEIFPDDKPVADRQLPSRTGLDVLQKTRYKQIRDFHILESENNNASEISCNARQNVDRGERISCSSLNIQNAGSTTTSPACALHLHNLYEEPCNCDVWEQIFPSREKLEARHVQQTPKDLGKTICREKAMQDLVHVFDCPESESTDTRQIFLKRDKTESDWKCNSVQCLNCNNDTECNPAKPFFPDCGISHSKSSPTEHNGVDSFLSDDVGINSHVFSIDKIDRKTTFENEEFEQSSDARTIKQQMIKLTTTVENEYDSITEYEQIHVGLSSTTEKGQCDTRSKAKRPLPIIPHDMEETLGFKGRQSNARAILSRRRCILIVKIALVLILLIVTMSIAVIITTVVLNMRNDEDTDINAKQARFKVQAYLYKSRLINVIPGDEDGYVYGITVLGKQLFVARGDSFINVYNSITFTLTHNLTIKASSSVHAVIASSKFNCLYILCTPWLNVIHRYNLSDNVTSNWSIGDEGHALSLTSTHNILVTLEDTEQIKEYAPDGRLIREIRLQTIVRPCHIVQLSSGEFVVGHAGLEHRVCLVDKTGLTLQCYGGSPGSDARQFNVPVHLAADTNDIVIVANYLNNNVVLLSSSLTNLGNITLPGHQLVGPHALHVDELNHRLYIGEWANKRISVLTTV